jgi:hypothetical protein
LCGTTDKSIFLSVDSGRIPNTNISVSNLLFCGGLNNANLNFNVTNIISGDSIFYGTVTSKSYLGKANPFLLNIQKSIPFKIYLKNSNGCFNQSNKYIGDFRPKINATFSKNYVTSFTYKFKSNDTISYSKWYLSENGILVDSFTGKDQNIDLSQYADKVLNMKHLVIDSINNSNQCSDTSSLTFQVLNYSKVVNILNNQLKISPNPISKGDLLQIHTKDQIQSIKILTIEGRFITALKVNKYNQVEVIDNIPSATYVIEIVTNKGCYKEKLSIN